ncbi:MAG: nucleotidyltransferase family protein [Candidatus Rokubacteria bacterium]|nr:nucleotidyltransferase family protein [Candidatus Rokubacteria bacterium]
MPSLAVDDWYALLARARAERVAPLLAGAPGPPPAVGATLERDRRATLGRALLRGRAVAETVAALAAAGVEPVLLKGHALAETVYGDPGRRPMDDVDLLVPRESLSQVIVALAPLGYAVTPQYAADVRRRAATLLVPSPRGSRPALDVHWDLVDARCGPAAARWSRGALARAERAPSTPGARVLEPADAVIHACVHLTVHHGLAGLRWYCDLAMMARAWRGRFEWDAVAARSLDAGLGGIVWAPLAVAEIALGPVAPSAALARLAPRGARARAFARWLLPRIARLERVPRQDRVVPLLLLERGRDVARLVTGRLARRAAAQ